MFTNLQAGKVVAARVNGMAREWRIRQKLWTNHDSRCGPDWTGAGEMAGVPRGRRVFWGWFSDCGCSWHGWM